jgi:hypothetical protein
VSDEAETGVPPAGEQLHVPSPSALPIVLAVGATIALLGVTLGILLVAIGLVIAVPALVLWIRGARGEYTDLPPGH